MQKKRLHRPEKSYDEIKLAWEKIKSLDIKNRFKSMRPISNDICEIFKKNNASLEQLDFYIKVLKEVNQVHDIPRCKRTLSSMIATWLDMKGLSNAKTLQKLTSKVNTETASIAIADPYFAKNIADTYANYSEKSILHLMNQGQAYVFATGGDGLYNVQIRIVDSVEPVLSSKEYKCVMDATETAIINVTSGKIVIDDPSALDSQNTRVVMSMEPGHYKVGIYFFYIRSKVESFYIVLCKTDESAKNSLVKLPQLI